MSDFVLTTLVLVICVSVSSVPALDCRFLMTRTVLMISESPVQVSEAFQEMSAALKCIGHGD